MNFYLLFTINIQGIENVKKISIHPGFTVKTVQLNEMYSNN